MLSHGHKNKEKGQHKGQEKPKFAKRDRSSLSDDEGKEKSVHGTHQPAKKLVLAKNPSKHSKHNSISNEERRAQVQKSRVDLPIYKAKAQILDALKTNDTLVLVGETGKLGSRYSP
jgi:HrpA-like RNA helicase